MAALDAERFLASIGHVAYAQQSAPVIGPSALHLAESP
jgi:hypothetical protein